ncbi:hypothetical protein JCM21738_2620 [Mesobacillus boroniphilus JCM 21738]|uniref:Uncharacterized protein n=1 Tax=Mesobacillus boroniphilus JCM 21738 TaxID=1294265 RepID=W4RPH8_9BACI|nr:hypothetical protein JCM21738_2620 [Mesobacillus boroniphilus JCM 21738]
MSTREELSEVAWLNTHQWFFYRKAESPCNPRPFVINLHCNMVEWLAKDFTFTSGGIKIEKAAY